MKDLVLIIDFMNYVHRCRVGKLQGEYIIIYNFFRNLRATVEQFKPKKIFFALEGHPQHRIDLYPEYKANRLIKTAAQHNKLDKVFKSADQIQQLLLLLPVALLYHPNFEADDIIATWCKNIKEENIIIISNDSDYIQVLQNGYHNCKVFNPFTKDYMVSPPYPYVAWKSLHGDKTDNIAPLLSPKKSLECLSNPEKFKNFLSIEENRANFNINRQLIEFGIVPEEEIILTDGHTDFVKLKEIFSNMEFATIINDKSWKKFISTFDCVEY